MQKEEKMTPHVMRHFEKAIMLQTLDTSWREHLAAMDYLRQGIHLRGYAQKNPKQEYKREAFELFAELLDKINYEVISTLSKFEVRAEQEIEQLDMQQRSVLNPVHMEYKHEEPERDQDVVLRDGTGNVSVLSNPTFNRGAPKLGRNDPCACGSGKKYKQCHGKLN